MVYRVLLLSSSLLIILGAFASEGLQAHSGCIPGTYLVVQEDGTQSLWTLSADGTLQLSSSAEVALGFGHEQGIWKPVGSRRARAVALDFNFADARPDGGVPPAAIARVDAGLRFSKRCRFVKGSFELRFFDGPLEDPLVPDSDLGEAIVGKFTGRRLTLRDD